MSFTPKFSNLVSMLEDAIAQHGPRPLWGVKKQGVWTWVSYSEFGEMVDACRAALANKGVAAGDRVAVISNNRLEWLVAAFATYGLGAAFVPMYEAQLDKDWDYILKDSGAKLCFVAGDVIEKRVQGFAPDMPLVSFDKDWKTFLASGSPTPSLKPAKGDIALFVYTSGTTGNPKGVVLTHLNVAANASGVQSVFSFGPEDRSPSSPGRTSRAAASRSPPSSATAPRRRSASASTS
jgi:long-chain acyl-CoA synthetase